jgi:hypothetical protein
VRATVFLTARHPENAKKVADAIRATGGKAEVDQVDALDQRAVNDHAQRVVERAGTLDISFNLINIDDTQNIPLIEMSTELVAAVAEVSSALGVLWADAPAVHSRRLFVDEARDISADDPPLPLWLGLSIARRSEQRVSLLTLGMPKLGHPNLRIEGSADNATLGFVFDTAKYLVVQNATIHDGDTVGHSATQRIRVRHEPSPIDPTETVLAIELPPDF